MWRGAGMRCSECPLLQNWYDVIDHGGLSVRTVLLTCLTVTRGLCSAGDGCDHVALTSATPIASANSNSLNAVSLSPHSALIESPPPRHASVVAKSTSSRAGPTDAFYLCKVVQIRQLSQVSPPRNVPGISLSDPSLYTRSVSRSERGSAARPMSFENNLILVQLGLRLVVISVFSGFFSM